MNNTKKTVLFISYYYPSGILGAYERVLNVGSERVLKFRKFLPEFGYDTRVLTTQRWGNLSDDKKDGVYRALDLSSIFNRIYNWISAYFWSSGPKFSSESSKDTLPRGKALESPAERIKQWMRQWLLIPDIGILWFPFAVWTGYKLIRSEKVDVIVATFTPAANLLVGACLSIIMGIPLVLDFRDGWLFESLEPFLRYNGFRKAIDSWLERWVVSRSKAIVTVSDPLTEYFRQAYILYKRQTFTITNGFDPDNWSDVISNSRTNDKLRIVHTGSFGASGVTRNLTPFLNGLIRIPASIRSQLEIILVGSFFSKEFKAINDLGLNDVIHVLPPVKREQSLGFQLSADVLLLIAGTDRSVASSKLFEYLYARRPILVLGDRETAACQIVDYTKAGVLVDPENSELITSEIVRLFELWQKGDLGVYGKGDIGMYHRRNLSTRLASVLDQVLMK